jgi:uncharacterized protein YegL
MPFPDVKLARRPLHFIFLCDCSGSMQAQGKMESLNQAIRQALPAMAEVAHGNPEASVLVRVVGFSTEAGWHIAAPTPAAEIAGRWRDLAAQPQGLTSMGAAVRLVAEALRSPPMEPRALPPVLVLISDGAPTDDYGAGLEILMREPWARKAVRLAIAIGHDADHDELQRFIGADQLQRPLQANDARTLARYMRWASTAVIDAVSRPLTATGGAMPARNVAMPDLPLMPDLPATLVDPLDPDPDLSQTVW